MSMTPERIEEIRQAHANGVSRGERTLSIGLDTLGDLLAALTESQQTIARLKDELEEMTINRNIWRSNSNY
jgi:uncharacterized coiled-coil protein SlyX